MPTPEANELFQRVNETLSSIDRLGSFADDIRQMRRGSVRVASLVGPSLFALPNAIARFTADYPGVKVSLQTRSSTVVKDWARDDVLDIGLSESTFGEDVRVLEEFEMECVMAVPKDHRLGDRAEINPKDLIGERLISLYLEHTTSMQLRTAFSHYMRPFEPDIETYLFGPLCALVLAGAGVGLTDPLSASAYLHTGLIFRKFRPKITFKLMLIAPKHRQDSRNTTRMISYISEEMKSQAKDVLSML